jgi:hypothetical protein
MLPLSLIVWAVKEIHRIFKRKHPALVPGCVILIAAINWLAHFFR